MKAPHGAMLLRMAASMAVAPVLATALAPAAVAATAYVTDELVLNVYSQENSQGQRLATLRSGAAIEALTASGESTQVRLPDGRTGWVKTSYLTTHEPAVVRLKQLQDEMDRSKSTTPGVAQAAAVQAAAHAEIERLTRELAAARQRHDEPRSSAAAAAGSAAEAPPIKTAAAAAANAVLAASPAVAADQEGVAVREAQSPVAAFAHGPWLTLAAIGVAAGLGYWLGYASLARRVREKFGGIKVY